MVDTIKEHLNTILHYNTNNLQILLRFVFWFLVPGPVESVDNSTLVPITGKQLASVA